MKESNNSSYMVYISNSFEAARLISRGLREATPWSRSGGETIRISCGYIEQDCRIPAIYHGDGKYYALIEYRNGEDWNHPEYKVTLC